MSEIRVASRYAKSLLELAIDKGLLEDIKKDIQLIANTAKTSREFERMLESPVVSHNKKLEILKAIFQGKVNEMTMSFLDIVTDKGRADVLPAVLREFKNQYNAYKGIAVAEVITTFGLTDDLRAKFIETAKKVSGAKEIELKEKVSKDLIGGYILKVGDKQIDDSLSSKLHELKKELILN